MVKYTELAVANPIAVGVDAAGKSVQWLKPLIKVDAIAGLSSVILASLLSQPRIFYTMSRDGLLPSRLAVIHPRFKTPYVTTLITGCAAMIIGGVFPIDFLGELVSIGTLMAFAIVCVSVLVLRYTRPEYPRPFRTPWVPVVPVLGALLSVGQMLALPQATWIRLIVWMAVGMIIYIIYGYHHSRMGSLPQTNLLPLYTVIFELIFQKDLLRTRRNRKTEGGVFNDQTKIITCSAHNSHLCGIKRMGWRISDFQKARRFI